jgi:pimeloyl-ACP methyl ester carboxylesterase
LPQVEVDDVTLEHEQDGTEGPLVLLGSGLGAQLVWWPHGFVRGLVDRGLRVLRYDNRDVGRSTWFDGAPGTAKDVQRRLAGEHDTPLAYTLGDMAADAVGLLDALGESRAHVVGASMGGMIAQHLAFSYPDRVASLTSIMSTTGERTVGQSTPEAMQALMTAPPADRDRFVDVAVRASRAIASPTLFDEQEARARLLAAYDRGYNPPGVARQFLAILADRDRTARLAGVRAPTLVVHGVEDPLIDVSGGRATAAAIPGAELVEVEEMGHDMPAPLLPTLVSLVADHVARAELHGH